MRNHILIAGTGRAGTSALVRIFHACGFDTEISRERGSFYWDPDANAGIETIPLIGEDHPYVVKSPWSYQFIEELVDRPDIKLDAVIIPIRNLEDAASSRIILEIQHRYRSGGPDLHLALPWKDAGSVAGGAVYSLEPLDQERILAHAFHKLIESLVRKEIPIKFLSFPRFVEDHDYLYRALGSIVREKMSANDFFKCVGTVLDPALVRVHDPSLQDSSKPPREPNLKNDFSLLDRTALTREVQKLRSELVELTNSRRSLAEEASRRTPKSRIRQVKTYVASLMLRGKRA